jgi:polar amino acid transport system substrate-binding protein
MNRLVEGWLFLSLLFVAAGAETGRYSIYTEVDPPYNFTNRDGRPTGLFVDLVREIQARLGNADPILVVPWARGYREILERPSVILFAMARTPERERLFHWIGPVIENRWILFAKRESSLTLKTLEDARGLSAIGTVRDFAWDQYLEGLGFTNLERVSENGLNLHKAVKGRIPAFVGADLSFPSVASRAGYRAEDFKPLLVFRSIPLYIALSRRSPASAADEWNRCLSDLIAEGALEKLKKRYLAP